MTGLISGIMLSAPLTFGVLVLASGSVRVSLFAMLTILLVVSSLFNVAFPVGGFCTAFPAAALLRKASAAQYWAVVLALALAFAVLAAIPTWGTQLAGALVFGPARERAGIEGEPAVFFDATRRGFRGGRNAVRAVRALALALA